MNYIEIDTDTLRGCVEYKATGSISKESNEGEHGANLFADDLKALDETMFSYGSLCPGSFETVGYADLGSDYTTTIRMCGELNEYGWRPSVEIGSIDDNYFLECFNAGMTRDEIKEELANMIIDEVENFCGEHKGISLINIDIDYLKNSIDHPINVVDKHLNHGNFLKAENQKDIEIDER